MYRVLIIFFLFSQFCFSQLGKPENETLNNESSNYLSKDKTDEFTVYNFTGEIPKLNGETCKELTSYYIDNETKICFKEAYTSCSQASNTYVQFLNSIAVQIEPLKWKDYENNSLYTLQVVDKFCYVEHYYDNEDSSIKVDENYDTDRLLAITERFCEIYFPTHLSQLTEEGNAYEFEDARDYQIGDINLDGKPDVVVIYTVEGIGGNNWERHILLITTDGQKINGWKGDIVYGKFQSDSKFNEIKNGYAIFKRYKPEFGGKQTDWEKIGFGIRNDKLVTIEIPK